MAVMWLASSHVMHNLFVPPLYCTSLHGRFRVSNDTSKAGVVKQATKAVAWDLWHCWQPSFMAPKLATQLLKIEYYIV